MKDNKLFFSNNTSPLTIAIILLPDLQHRTMYPNPPPPIHTSNQS
ncbi:Uncharacterized protein HZ326_13597, partial [Fusarium oxysporum f. sp. albedinis]